MYDRKFGIEDLAILIGMSGAVFALGAATFVWFARGQVAWVTIAASIWALDMSTRYFLKRRKHQKELRVNTIL